METGTVTIKGQVVIPSKIRKRFGIRKGTKICFLEEEDEIVMRPLTHDYFEKMAGILSAGGKLTKELLASRARDRRREAGR